jgi:LacI family transcriptional regulator
VARAAGVSQALVSYILNDKEPVTVAAETRQRVLDIAASLGYEPNSAARSLSMRKTLTLAGIIPDITNPFFPAFERAIQKVAEENNYHLIMYNTDGNAEKERQCLRFVQQGRVDGVIFVGWHMGADDLKPLLDRHIPVVTLDNLSAPDAAIPLDCIYADDRAAARSAVTYLLDKGHSRIALINGQEGTRPAQSRHSGYSEALAEKGIAVDPRLIRYTDFTGRAGMHAMEEILLAPERPTAVFCAVAADVVAVGAMRAIRDAGLSIPADMAIVGFDDIEIGALTTPSLTTVTQFPAQLGRRAAELLLDRLNGTAPDTPRVEQMPYELIVRESA